MKDRAIEALISYLKSNIESVKKETRYPFEKEAEIYYYSKILNVAEQFYELSKKSSNNENTKIEALEKENKKLREQLNKNQSDKIKTAHEVISEIIAEKVYNTVRSDLNKFTKTAIKREILEALKWELQVRYAVDLKEEHIEPAKEFIQNYEINDFYLNKEAKVNERFN